MSRRNGDFTQFLALACDGDGTVATRKKIAKATVQSLRHFRETGRKLILATGETEEQIARFPDVELFDVVVGENGAILYWPSAKAVTSLANRCPKSLLEELRKAKVPEVTHGRTIVSTVRPYDKHLAAALALLELDWRIIYNRHEAMALPRGVDKSTGLCAALKELGISPRHVVAIGDAENDVALLKCCGLGAAVGTAVPMLKRAATVVTRAGSGRGVVNLIERILANRSRDIVPVGGKLGIRLARE